MVFLRKILFGVLVVALLYGGLFLVERLTAQELTRAEQAETQKTVRLMWKPRLIRGGGVCTLDLLSAAGKVVDSVQLGRLDTGFNALQKFGQLEFQDQEVIVTNLQTGELVRRFVVRDGRLILPDSSGTDG